MEFASAAIGKLRLALEKRGVLFSSAAAFVGGFLTSASSVLSSVSPFGVAFVGACGEETALWAGAGAVIGYLTQTDEGLSLRYLASVVLLMGLRWSFGFMEKGRLLLYTPLMAGLSVAVTGFSVAFSGIDTVYGWEMAALESAICASAGILFSKAMRSFDGTLQLSGTSGVCTAVLLSVLVTGAANVFPGKFPPVYALALWFIMVSACFGKGGQAVTVGACAGVAAALTGQNSLFGILTVSSLASSAFSPLGKAACVISVSFAGSLAALAAGDAAAVRPFLLSCLFSGCAFIAAPLSAIKSLGLTPTSSANAAPFGELVSLRLFSAEAGLKSIAETAKEISAVIDRTKADRAQSLMDCACEKVCRSCSKRTECWQNNFDLMTKYVGDVFYGRILSLPAEAECKKSDELSSLLRSAGEKHSSGAKMRADADSFKHIVAEQFSSSASVIESLRQEFSSCSAADDGIREAVSEILSSLCRSPVGAGCFLTGDGRCRVLARVPARKASRIEPEKSAQLLSEAVCQRLSPAVTTDADGDVFFLWESAPPFEMEACLRQKSADDSRFCGDSCTAFTTSGCAVLIIADGMGVGQKAAVDSAMSVSLLERLIKSGVGIDASFEVLTSALLSRGCERLCAVDSAVIDLTTLHLECRKAGAPPSFVWRRGKVHTIDSASLPIGILEGVDTSKSVFALHEGDVLVLVSDGLIEGGGEWLPSQISAFAEGELSALCDSLIDTAQKRLASSRRDDCTVVAARIRAAK